MKNASHMLLLAVVAFAALACAVQAEEVPTFTHRRLAQVSDPRERERERERSTTPPPRTTRDAGRRSLAILAFLFSLTHEERTLQTPTSPIPPNNATTPV